MSTPRTTTDASTSWATGVVVFAAAMLLTSGLFQILQGIVAIAGDDVLVSSGSYTFELDTTTWGWIHVVMGLVLGLTGFFLFTGQGWARVIGIVLAVLSLLTNFAFLPYYPFWAILVIAIDVLVIWAISRSMAPPVE